MTSVERGLIGAVAVATAQTKKAAAVGCGLRRFRTAAVGQDGGAEHPGGTQRRHGSMRQTRRRRATRMISN
jgi:hypothetical protein